MKILILLRDQMDGAFMRQALEKSGHQIVQIETSEQAWPVIEQGQPLFMIADWEASDLSNQQFIHRARALKTSAPLYFLLLTSKKASEDLPSNDADAILRKPFSAQELRKHIAIGERIITLAGSLAHARAQLESAAMFDGLTNLMNRPAFYRQATGELERARRASAAISLIALDIDNFKTLYDTYGNPAGDEILRMIAQTIREKSRPYDCIGRWTEAGFMIALPGVIGADAQKIAERIINGILAARIEISQDKLIDVHTTAGIACVSHINASTDVEPLIEQARQAMSRAKEAGGDQIYLAYV
jgi:diguanylate cyclase (GGDEF)-like protein